MTTRLRSIVRSPYKFHKVHSVIGLVFYLLQNVFPVWHFVFPLKWYIVVLRSPDSDTVGLGQAVLKNVKRFAEVFSAICSAT